MIPLRAKRGANTVFFTGRVPGRRLDPGLHGLSFSTTRRPQPGAAATTVRVVSARRSVPVKRPALLAACAPAHAFLDDGTRRILVAEATAPRPRSRPTTVVAGLPNAEVRPPKQAGDMPAPEGDGVAGGLLPDPGGAAAESADGGLESFAAIAVLLVVAGLLFGMIALVTRFLRGSWYP